MTRKRRKVLGIVLSLLACAFALTGVVLALFLGRDEIGFVLYVALAMLSIALVIAGIALLHESAHVRMRLRDGTFCPHCEYDLRATPDGRCPECGWKASNL